MSKRKQDAEDEDALRPTLSVDERNLLDYEDGGMEEPSAAAAAAAVAAEELVEGEHLLEEREEGEVPRDKFGGERREADAVADAAVGSSSTGPTPPRKRIAVDDGSGSAKATPASQRLTRERIVVHEFECLDGSLFPEVMNEVSRDYWRQLNMNAAKRLRTDRVDVVLADGYPAGRRDINALYCRLKCRIDAPVITNKVTLQLLLNRNEPTLALPGHAIQKTGPIPSIPDGEAWLFRPEGGQGSAQIVTSNAQLRVVVERHRSDPKAKRAVLSRYMLNPLLIDGRKAVLRVYFIASVSRRHVKTWVLRDGLFGIAPKPFVAGKFDDMRTHSTRLWNSPYSFPRDYPGGAEAAAAVFESVVSSLRRLAALAAPRFKRYEESDHGFELFGCDFLIDENGNAFLSNFRSKPGFPVHYKELQEKHERELAAREARERARSDVREKEEKKEEGERDEGGEGKGGAEAEKEEGEVDLGDAPAEVAAAAATATAAAASAGAASDFSLVDDMSFASGTTLTSEDLSVVTRYIYRNLRDLVILPYFDRTPAESADAVLVHEGELALDL